VSQASVDFVVDGYRRYNERDRSQPWPPDHELAIWHEDAEYVAARFRQGRGVRGDRPLH
jgi:hypothetical protein